MTDNIIEILKRAHFAIITFMIILQIFSSYMTSVRKQYHKIYKLSIDYTSTLILSLGVIYYRIIDNSLEFFLISFVLLFGTSITKEVILRKKIKQNERELDCIVEGIATDIEGIKEFTPMPVHAYSIMDLNGKENKKGLKIEVRNNEYIVVMFGSEPVRIFNEFNKKTVQMLNSMGYIIVYHGRG